MKDYKFIQTEISEPWQDKPSEHNMPERVRQLQADGYVVENVTVSQPIQFLSKSETRSSGYSRTEYDYRTMITYVLVKEY